MKKLLIPGLCFILTFNIWLVDIFSFTVPKIEGGTQSFSAYQGKKILVITLPLQQNPSSDSLLYSLDSLASVHSTILKVIAVPGIEDGYTEAQRNQLEQWYRSKLGTSIIITDGLHTRKSSGNLQHPLFSWLTHETENEHFDIDVTGPGVKFFANANGELVGVLKPLTPISGSAVNKLLQLQ